MRPGEVFLSHSHVDRAFARRFCAALATHGVRCWYAPYRIVGSQRWHDEIGRALTRCDWFVLLLSPAAVASRWVKRELLFALSEDRFEDRIVPVLVKNCRPKRLSWTLDQIQRVDFRKGFGEGVPNLLEVWSTRPGMRGNRPRK